MGVDYSTVTEIAGVKASCGQLAMLYSRYKYAAQFCKNKDVLEVACGSGQGLGYLARSARFIIGGDYTGSLLHLAQAHYKSQLPLVQLDAHTLPFRSESFDVVLLYEAIYYLVNPALFFKECRRVLRRDGLLLICTVNKEWSDFNPSPFSTQHLSAHELVDFLQKSGFQSQIFGAFPVGTHSLGRLLVSLIKRTAVAFHLIPKTMKGKEFLKRVFFGKLEPLPSEVIEGMASYEEPRPLLPLSQSQQYKILYALGHVE
jgi:ubiquinone/menaquinone biosynthesis C-methylase UbiE